MAVTIALTPVAPARALPPFMATATLVRVGDGFYEVERDEADAFHWMSTRGRLDFEARPEVAYLELSVGSEFRDQSQVLTIQCGRARLDLGLNGGWTPLSIPVAAGVDSVTLSVNKIFPRAYYPTDTRELAIRVRPPRLHADATRHAEIRRQQENATANLAELMRGHVALSSTPPSLGIDLHGACNVKPPCVYCEWDVNKAFEGENVDTPFTLQTLDAWGEFFANSTSLVNCSIGEPFMMRNLDDLLDVFGDRGKVLETTTNGQILTDRNIQKLLRRQIDLYVSLDAATPTTYAQLRNDTFEKILRNLRRLIEAKGGPGQLPRVHLVFMPMRCNVHELDAFIHLCADLRVDRMVLRPLNYSDSIDLDWERAGYRYQYKNELLPFEELVRVSGRAAELCRRLGVPLADQMDFGSSMESLFHDTYEDGRRSATGGPAPPGADAEAASAVSPPVSAPAALPAVPRDEPPPPQRAELPAPDMAETVDADTSRPSLGHDRMPACTEPWKSLYILRRGVFPCCYGGVSIAPMDEYREAWNGPLMQDIRRDLLAGRFHEYCIRSPACPIVRKLQQADELPLGQAVWLRTRQLWSRFDRMTLGWARVFSRPFIRTARIVSHPRRSLEKLRARLAA